MAIEQNELSLEPASAADEAFLLSLYADVRAPEMAFLPLPEAQKGLFLQSQFHAQEAQYRSAYPDADFLIICQGGTQIGRFSLVREQTRIHAIDLAVLSDWRGQGIGTAVFQQLLDEAKEKGVPVTLSVAMGNPAIRLYERLGFTLEEEQPPYQTMKWRP